jgi:hypothetical protein
MAPAIYGLGGNVREENDGLKIFSYYERYWRIALIHTKYTSHIPERSKINKNYERLMVVVTPYRS